jgi:polyisoprenoid-binding protein YceI
MKRYRLDLEKSQISWTGAQPEKEISGIVFFKSGMICIDENNISEAELIIDMNSIQATDKKLDKENSKKLSEHLKSADFFNSAIYPKGIIKTTEIKKVIETEPSTINSLRVANPTHEVTALLTIKEITQEIKLPVKITFVNNHIKAEAQINIDRTEWALNFMIEDSYGDQKIKPFFLVDIKITAEGIDK